MLNYFMDSKFPPDNVQPIRRNFPSSQTKGKCFYNLTKRTEQIANPFCWLLDVCMCVRVYVYILGFSKKILKRHPN